MASLSTQTSSQASLGEHLSIRQAVARHKEIADILTAEILLSQYRTGERLPSERDLSVRFSSNRGCIREAIKNLEQLGLVDVQPGGARVCSLERSSLDIIGHLLKLGEFPDPELVDDILEVMHSLLSLAVKRAMSRADEAMFARLETQVQIMLDTDTPAEHHMQARMELGREFMQASGSLPLKLIAYALRLQFLDHLLPLVLDAGQNKNAHLTELKQLNKALKIRDSKAVASAMQSLFETSASGIQKTLHSLRDTSAKQTVSR